MFTRDRRQEAIEDLFSNWCFVSYFFLEKLGRGDYHQPQSFCYFRHKLTLHCGCSFPIFWRILTFFRFVRQIFCYWVVLIGEFSGFSWAEWVYRLLRGWFWGDLWLCLFLFLVFLVERQLYWIVFPLFQPSCFENKNKIKVSWFVFLLKNTG